MTDHEKARDEIAEWLALDDGYTYTDFASAFGERAELVVRHLWRRADDPEVQEAVQMALADGNGHIYGLFEAEAVEVITATLTALLGPKPEEVECDS